jgi:hypothetical protein
VARSATPSQHPSSAARVAASCPPGCWHAPGPGIDSGQRRPQAVAERCERERAPWTWGRGGQGSAAAGQQDRHGPVRSGSGAARAACRRAILGPGSGGTPRAWEASSAGSGRPILQLSARGHEPWLSVDDRWRPMLRARRGHGPVSTTRTEAWQRRCQFGQTVRVGPLGATIVGKAPMAACRTTREDSCAESEQTASPRSHRGLVGLLSSFRLALLLLCGGLGDGRHKGHDEGGRDRGRGLLDQRNTRCEADGRDDESMRPRIGFGLADVQAAPVIGAAVIAAPTMGKLVRVTGMR